jgi:dTDP-3-amino-3,4,6-trideoxy-alpha-D-glucose transaminase
MATVAPSRVPFVDLRRVHEPLLPELVAAFEAVVRDSGFVLGREVAAFEEEFAAFCGVRHCVGVASGTAALTLALLATGVRPGDEVIVPAHTYVATGLAVVHAGGVPVFCDVLADTGLIDLNSAEHAVSARTAAIVPVHLYGRMCAMDGVMEFAARHGVCVVEDAAQAHGASWSGRRSGSWGAAAAFSFYPSKNLGGLGDGGAICTDDAAVAERARRLRNLGQRGRGEHLDPGFNERLDGVQAALLRVKLRRLEQANAARSERARLYGRLLPAAVASVGARPGDGCVHHLFPVRTPCRDELRAALAIRGVQTGIHYTPAMHQQPAFRAVAAPRTDVAEAERWAAEELSLPMFAELSEQEVRRVAETVETALGRSAA